MQHYYICAGPSMCTDANFDATNKDEAITKAMHFLKSKGMTYEEAYLTNETKDITWTKARGTKEWIHRKRK